MYIRSLTPSQLYKESRRYFRSDLVLQKIQSHLYHSNILQHYCGILHLGLVIYILGFNTAFNVAVQKPVTLSTHNWLFAVLSGSTNIIWWDQAIYTAHYPMGSWSVQTLGTVRCMKYIVEIIIGLSGTVNHCWTMKRLKTIVRSSQPTLMHHNDGCIWYVLSV